MTWNPNYFATACIKSSKNFNADYNNWDKEMKELKASIIMTGKLMVYTKICKTS